MPVYAGGSPKDRIASLSPLCLQARFLLSDSGGTDSWSSGNSESWNVCRCTLEVLHRTLDLPHRCVTRPHFCSQILVDLDSQSSGYIGSWDVCRCTLRFSTGPNSFPIPAVSACPFSALRIWWILTASPLVAPKVRTYPGVRRRRRSPSLLCHYAQFLLSRF